MNDTNKQVMENIQSYLTFEMGNEHFAVNVSKVIEILEVPSITKIPRSPSYLLGVINLRGKVLPVIDTRIKFGMTPTEISIDTCIIVMTIEVDEEEITLGALVDSVDEVLEISQQEISASPSIGSQYDPKFILGVVKKDDHFFMILNIGKVFSIEEVEDLEQKKIEVKKESKTDNK